MTNTGTTYSAAQLLEAIDRLPRFSLAHLPTPLEHLAAVFRGIGWSEDLDQARRLHWPSLWRQQNTTQRVLDRRCDLKKERTRSFGAPGIQSNNCRQTAAACAKAGLDCHLVLGRGKPADGPDPIQGNLLLDYLVGATVDIVDDEVGPAARQKNRSESAARLRERRSKCLRMEQKDR